LSKEVLAGRRALLGEPEKALLGQLHMMTRRLASLALDELDLSSLNPKRSQVYALRFRQTCRPLWSK